MKNNGVHRISLVVQKTVWVECIKKNRHWSPTPDLLKSMEVRFMYLYFRLIVANDFDKNKKLRTFVSVSI